MKAALSDFTCRRKAVTLLTFKAVKIPDRRHVSAAGSEVASQFQARLAP